MKKISDYETKEIKFEQPENIVEADIKSIIEQVGIPLSDLEGKRVFISGACGFLGSWFIAIFEALNKTFKKPIQVIAMDSFIAADKQNAITEISDKNIKFVRADISDPSYKHEKYDYIIHAAGIASPIYYRKFPIETIDGMVLGLSHLLKHAISKPVASFLYFSSSEMYGNPHPDQVPTKETYYGNVSATGPRSCYDESKRMGEAMCASYHRIHHIPVKWVRPFNVYGPGMRINDDRVVPKFIFNVLKNKPITVHIPGIQTRTFCYVTDAMVGFLKTMLVGKDGEVYNIGRQDEEITMIELAEKMLPFFRDKNVYIDKVEMPTEYPRDQAQRRCPDVSKAKEDMDYQPKVALVEGLSRMIKWCKQVI